MTPTYQLSGQDGNGEASFLEAALGKRSYEKAYLVYKLVPSPQGRPDKVPCNPETGGTEAPNDASTRARMTLGEAMEAAQGLGDGFGVGCFPARLPGLVAVDLDSCVALNGDVHLDPWARAIVGDGEAYCELSPSGTGVRMLLLDPEDKLLPLSSGVERCGIGLYGRPDCKKFVTLTGMALPESSVEVRPAGAVASRILAHLSKMMGQERLQSSGMDYPSGEEGMRLAEEDVLSGASLHPATVRLASGWWADVGMGEQEVRERLLELYDRSAARTHTPRRWRARRDKSITGVLAWLKGRQDGPRLGDVPTQARQAARALVERHKGAREAGAGGWGPQAQAVAPEAPRGAAVGGQGWKWGESSGEGMASGLAEADSDDWESRWAAMILRDLDELERAKEEDNRWMMEPPSVALQLLSKAAWDAAKRPTPQASVITALSMLSVASQHRFLMSGLYLTPLNLQGTVVMPTGSGKEALRGLLRDVASACKVSAEGRPASGVALHTALSVAKERSGSPNVLLVMDEVSSFLSAAGNPKAAGTHAEGLKFELMSVATSAMGSYDPSSYSQRSNTKEKIDCPYLVSIGFTTPAVFEKCMGIGFMADGWVNRQLIALGEEGSKHPAGHRYRPGLPEEVRSLVEEVREGAYLEKIRVTEFEGEGVESVRDRRFRIIRIDQGLDEWIDAVADAEMDALPFNAPQRSALSRVGEMIRKVSALMAVGDAAALGLPWSTLMVGKAHVEWSARLVVALAHGFIRMSEGRREGVLVEPSDRLRSFLTRWRLDPTSHPNEESHGLSRFFEVGEYPEWVLRKVVGDCSRAEFDSVAGNAGLVRAQGSRVARISLRGRAKEGVRRGPFWTYEELV